MITMRDRSKNRKPLQRGRTLSTEAIQTVQALKRVSRSVIDLGDGKILSPELERVFDFRFRRLLKVDMMAVLRELIRQQECFLALKVFEDARKEFWYKPQLFLYADLIGVLASNELLMEADLIFSYLKTEGNLEPDYEGFIVLFQTLICLKLTGFVLECYNLMKGVGCEPDRMLFRILINGLEQIGEPSVSAILRQEAQKYYGESLEFLKEEEETTASLMRRRTIYSS